MGFGKTKQNKTNNEHEDEMNSSSLFEDIVNATVLEFKKSVTTKLRDLNNFKVNIGGERKLYISYPIHRLVFGKAFGCEFTPKEGKYPFFEIKTLDRLTELFGSKSVLKMNSLGDLALATPVCYLEQLEDNYDKDLARGDLCIPIRQDGDDVHCFFPAGVDNDDKVQPLSSLLQYESSVVPERVQPGFTINIIKKKYVDYVSVASGHNLQEGDQLIVRGKSYDIIAISDDDASTSKVNSRNVIRVDRDFENSCTKQKLRFRKLPMVAGKIVVISCDHLRPHHRVQVVFKPNSGNDGNDHGVVEISFNNMIFNSSGILTQDRALSLAAAKSA